ncbi:MAG: complex I NDUFA9 subunit family protein [Xanthomonadales bacterium]|nr:complex I NDUFA9 subunit family protein [Xanthomonadales bacterium]
MNTTRHIVIVGGSGFIGRHLAARLANAGHRVTVTSRNPAGHGDLRLLPGLRLLQVDPLDQKALARAFAGADAVVNLVGILNERGFGGKGFRRAHVELTAQVIAACAAAGAADLVQMSALRAGEGDSHYLRTRGEAEALVRASTLRWRIVRPSVVFGPGDGLFNRFAGLLRLLPALPIARPGARFAPVHVGDVVEAVARCLARPETAGETFELYGARVMSLREIVAYTARHLGLRRWVIGLPDPLGRVQALVGDLIPGKPISSDNFRSLKLDSVGSRDGLAALGIAPTPVDAVVPQMLAGGRHQARLDQYRHHARRT